MNGINIYSILITIGFVLLGYLVSYVKTKSKLINKAEEFINVAEDNYKSVTQAGAEKFQFVVETLYNYTPAPLKIFITKDMISHIVQTAFDKMQEFANKQLDKIVDNIVKKEPDEAVENAAGEGGE